MERAILDGNLNIISELYYDDPPSQDMMDRIIRRTWNRRDREQVENILRSIDYLLSFDTSISVLVINAWLNTLEELDCEYSNHYPVDLTNTMIKLGKETIDIEVYIQFLQDFPYPFKDLGEILESRMAYQTK